MNILIFDKHSFTQRLVNFGEKLWGILVVTSQTPSSDMPFTTAMGWETILIFSGSFLS